MRISSEDIERQLLSGETLEWDDPDTGKPKSIQLTLARQRRLFKALLESPIRNVKGLPTAFIESLKEVYATDGDAISPPTAQPTNRLGLQKTWLLKKIEAYGFGGLSPSSQTQSVFIYEINGMSSCVEGTNGSGKSSLIAAVTWALTGLRPNDHMGPTALLNNAHPVLNQTGQEVATWPPIAAYPRNLEEMSKPPKVGVRLTFYDLQSGDEAFCTRKLDHSLMQ
jgi:AAA domain-containing protein